MSDYMTYRGKCKEMSEALCAKDSSLRLVRGHYYDAVWGEQPHWWCEDKNGNIIDPTKLQFPTKGAGAYVEFNGVLFCDNCEKETTEDVAVIYGRYAYCSQECCMRAVM